MVITSFRRRCDKFPSAEAFNDILIADNENDESLDALLGPSEAQDYGQTIEPLTDPNLTTINADMENIEQAMRQIENPYG